MEQLITPQELCERWGVSMKWVYNRTYRNELPHIKLGGLLRFREADLAKYVASQGRG